MQKNRASIQNMVLTALLAALTVLLGATPIGLIPLGFINVTILCVPVLVGTLNLGLRIGLALGACFGAVSALSAFGITMPPSALAGALAAASPLLTLLMCFLPRLLVPVVTHFAYQLAAQGNRRSVKALPIASAAGSLTNTVFYLGIMLLSYALLGLDTAAVLGIIGGTGLIAGGAEAVVAAVVVTPITVALRKIPQS